MRGRRRRTRKRRGTMADGSGSSRKRHVAISDWLVWLEARHYVHTGLLPHVSSAKHEGNDS